MAEKFVGCYISVDCGDLKGTYQGQVVKVDTSSQSLTLRNAWKNGLKCPTNEDVTILATDIGNLVVIPSPKDEKIKKSNPRDSPRKFESERPAAPETPNKTQLRQQKNKFAGGYAAGDTFSTDFNAEKDFDFETNLALFDKKTVMGEIQSGKQGSTGRQAPRTVPNFRHDENVLTSLPPMYRQIQLPSPTKKEFLTDSGLVVPAVTAQMRGEMQSTMEKLGIGVERRSESIARAVAEVSLHFVGGPHRLTPKNSHQKPLVVALCANHPEAAGVICAARHLATLGVRTIVYLQCPTVSNYLLKEIELYKLTGHHVINDEKRLPTESVDLILTCLLPPTYSGGVIPKMGGIIEWANKQRAPTVSIDQPPSNLIPPNQTWLDIKCSLSADLPLAYDADRDGKLYLYSLSTPIKVFQTLGIDYSSPFGSKFVITLHESC